MTDRNGKVLQWAIKIVLFGGLTVGLWLIGDMKSDMREMNRLLTNDIEHISQDVNNINQRLSRIEGRLGIDD